MSKNKDLSVKKFDSFINELHSDTYYSAYDKWKKRKPHSSMIDKFKKAGDARKQEELDDLWNSYPKTEMEDIYLKIRNELNFVFEKEPDNKPNLLQYKNKAEKSLRDCFIQLEAYNDSFLFMCWVNWDEEDPNDEQLAKNEDGKIFIEESSFMQHRDHEDLLEKVTARRLFRFLHKYKNKIPLSVEITGGDNNVISSIGDLSWYDLWHGRDEKK